jgi:hypothetical protein
VARVPPRSFQLGQQPERLDLDLPARLRVEDHDARRLAVEGQEPEVPPGMLGQPRLAMST